jgi:hypothetical protein
MLEACLVLVSCLTESREAQTWSQEVCAYGISKLNLRTWTSQTKCSLQLEPCWTHGPNGFRSTRKNLEKKKVSVRNEIK